MLLAVDDRQLAHLLVQVARAFRLGQLPRDQVYFGPEGTLLLQLLQEELFPVLLGALVEVVLPVEEAVFQLVERLAVLEDLCSGAGTSSFT